jgi:16S rRNA (adenine1518-N6/adenine1519-N6)-dimethyltransferase
MTDSSTHLENDPGTSPPGKTSFFLVLLLLVVILVIVGAVLMFQREVAERIVAAPGSKSYGRLSVITQWRCEARILFDVNASAFVPPPKVKSSLLRLVPRPTPMSCDRRLLETVTQAAFGQRRKMLRQSLRSLGADVADLITAAGLDPTARAEDISVEQFVLLARALAFQRNREA